MQIIIGIIMVAVAIMVLNAIYNSLKTISAKDKARYNAIVQEAKKAVEKVHLAASKSSSAEAKDVVNLVLKAANDAIKAYNAIKIGQTFSKARTFINTLNKSTEKAKRVAALVSNSKSIDWRHLKILAMSNPINDDHVPEILKTQPSYEAAMLIRDELIIHGYRVGEISIEKYLGQYAGKMVVYETSKYDSDIGFIVCSDGPMALTVYEMNLRMSNIGDDGGKLPWGNKYLAFENSFGLFLCDTVSSEPGKIPQWLKISVNVYMNSGFNFENPNWIYEHREAEEYLNVMLNKH